MTDKSRTTLLELNMTIYRGYDILPATGGGFYWTDKEGAERHGFGTEDAAMDAIDAYRRHLAEQVSS